MHLSRHSRGAVWAVVGLAFLLRATAVAQTAPPRPPNLLLIISDDQAWTDFGFMGHEVIRTPRLDRLAGESLTFTHGYVPASLCCPSLASIITGLFPHQHRVVCNDPPVPEGLNRRQFYASAEFRAGREKMSSFLEAVPTLPRLLQSRGYLSFQSGKWWQNHYSRGGFTHGMTVGEETKGGRHGDAGLQIGRQTLQPIYDFIAAAEGQAKPWMVWYAPMMPHDPHTPPERLLGRYRSLTNSLPVARYWAMVEWFDETCGQLLDYLDARGSADDTLVAFVVDNGWITDPVTGRYAPRSKQSPYDGGLRTPILLRWPGRIAPRWEETPVSSVDLMPTLLKAAGMERPSGLPGVDLREARAVRRRRAVTGACFTHDGQDLDDPASGLRWRWVVAGDWKLILPAPWNEMEAGPELYHLGRDPFERENLADHQSRRVTRLKARLDAWWAPRN